MADTRQRHVSLDHLADTRVTNSRAVSLYPGQWLHGDTCQYIWGRSTCPYIRGRDMCHWIKWLTHVSLFLGQRHVSLSGAKTCVTKTRAKTRVTKFGETRVTISGAVTVLWHRALELRPSWDCPGQMIHLCCVYPAINTRVNVL